MKLSTLLACFVGVGTFTITTTSVQATTDALCSLAPLTYSDAKKAHTSAADALAEIEKRGVATWYTDRMTTDTVQSRLQELVTTCSDTATRLSVVVYGMPNKDCSAGESSGGTVSTDDDYETFLTQLTTAVGDRKVLYIVEPDAMGLYVTDDCAKTYKYDEHLATAVRLLSVNGNADLYIDVGHWVLSRDDYLATVVAAIKTLLEAGRLRGIAINTSNYQTSDDMTALCGKFLGAIGNETLAETLHCVIDTSRNYNGPSSQGEWCNYKNAGIGRVPTSDTGNSSVDYFMWVKPPGESDGVCSNRTTDAMEGPTAGDFFFDGFKQQWNHGVLVKELNLAAIGSSSLSTLTIVLVCVGIVVLIGVVLGGGFYWRRRTMQQQSKAYYRTERFSA